ncbi:hypothetical protein T440DRAFT_517863 [Plenodomus tracheiphilus IPT5]|uniref:Uncharacterized protein n=1 Tax=Plenodomus tracheiphilus IPT5 TaxID=1408161 RepID=A0A6A7B887_9PLEO|nr:hypothetical protein T440DRAFT_517863 [Plenodomus tracheiphilus IPT5]
MSVLAFKALSYGAEQIPDKFFEKIPGGFFTPQESKDIKQGRKDRKDSKDRERRRSEERSDRRGSHRDRTLPADYSDHSAYDDNTDYEREREQRKTERRRAKSAGRSSSRSLSRGRNNRRSRDLDGEYSDSRDMAQPEQGAPYFPPPPTSEYKPYNPQEYSSPPAQNAYQPSPAIPAYGYSPQVNYFSNFRSRGATLSSTPEHPTPVNSCPPLLMNRPASSTSFFQFFPPPLLRTLSRGTPVSAAFSPSYEPPLAALLQQPHTNSPKPAAAQAYPPRQSSGQREAARSTASRYTPGPGYAPSPVNAALPPPPVGTHSPPYSPYNPSDYPRGNAGYAGNTYPSPPPFERQRSNSQPPYIPDGNAPYQTYIPPSADQQVTTVYDLPPSRRGSTRPRREHRHRAVSADSHSRSSKDHRRDSSRMSKVRDRFDGMDMREKGLAATVGGAAAGAIGGRTIAEKRSNFILQAEASGAPLLDPGLGLDRAVLEVIPGGRVAKTPELPVAMVVVAAVDCELEVAA